MASFEKKHVLSTFDYCVDKWDCKSAYISKKAGESRRLFQLLDGLVKDRDRILDIGCGTGKVGSHLKKSASNTRLVAIDFSINMLREVQLKLRKAFCVLSDVSKLGLRENLFDIVTCQQVLHHIPEPDIALREIFRTIKPGGHFLALTVGTQYQNEIFEYENGGNMTQDILGRVSNDEILQRISRAGFRLLHLVNDYFTFNFNSFEDYFNFLTSTGSARKIHLYKRPPQNYRQTLRNQLDAKGKIGADGKLMVTGHYTTVSAQKF